MIHSQIANIYSQFANYRGVRSTSQFLAFSFLDNREITSPAREYRHGGSGKEALCRGETTYFFADTWPLFPPSHSVLDCNYIFPCPPDNPGKTVCNTSPSLLESL